MLNKLISKTFFPHAKIHNTYTTTPSRKVYLVFPGQPALEVIAQTSADVYDVLKYMILQNIPTSKFCSVEDVVSRFVIYRGFKPLSRKHIPLVEYGIAENEILKIAYHGILGGSPPKILLPTYSHVQECEKLVLQNYTLQSGELEQDIHPPGTKLLESIFNSDFMKSKIIPEKGAEFIHNLLKKLLYLIHNMVEAVSDRERLIHLKHFLLGLVGSGWTYDFVEISYAYLSKLFKKENNNNTTDLNLQSSEDFFVDMKEFLGKADLLNNSPFFKKMYQLGLFILSSSLFTQFGINFDTFKYSKMEAAAIKERFHMGPSLILSLINSLIFVCEKGYQCYQSGSIEPLYHSGTQYEKWYDNVIDLKRKSRNLSCPEAHGFSLFEFLADLRDAIDKGESIVKYASKLGAIEKRSIKSLVNDLKIILDDNTTRREAQKERTAPFCISLYGGSSIGKTTITDMLFFQYGKTFDLPIESEFKYTRNPNAKFWDGFNTSQWFVIMDDIAFMNPKIAQSGDPSVMETIQTNNRVAFVPDQASLDDKGRTPFKARCVVATTNCEHLNSIYYFQTPLAMQRRFPFSIDVTVKEEFIKDVCMLDSSKTRLIPGQYPSFWIFTVKRPVPATSDRFGQRAIYEEVVVFTETEDFLAWFSEEAIKHEKIQKLIANSSDNMKNMSICKTCYRSSTCKCLKLQSGVITSVKHKIKKCIFDTSISIARSNIIPQLLHMAVNNPQIVSELSTICVGDLECNTESSPEYVQLDLCSVAALEQMERFTMDGEDFDAAPKLTIREHLYKLGEETKEYLGQPKFYASVLAVVGILYGSYRLYKKLTQQHVNLQNDSEGRAPISVGDEKPNVWHKDVYEMSSFDISDRARCFKSYSIDKVVNILQNNIIAIRAEYVREDLKRVREFRAICLGGHIYTTNLHNLPEQDCTLFLITTTVENGVTRNTKMLLSQELVWKNVANDLCAFVVDSLPPRRDLTDLFVSERNRAILKGRIIRRNNQGILESIIVQNYQNKTNFSINSDMVVPSAWVGYPEQHTLVGDCGALHIAETPLGPQILGIHVAGTDVTSKAICVATTITTEMAKNIIEHFSVPIIRDGVPNLSSESAPRELGDLDKKSTLRWIPVGVAAAYGSYVGWRNTPKSSVKPTIIQEAVLEEGIVVKHGKPVMKSYAPWRIAALDMVNPVTDLNQAVLAKCKASFLNDILNGISKEALDQVHVYDDITTLNGAPGVAFVDKMNRNTSMGAPWCTGKKHFLINLPASEQYPDAVAFKPEVMARVRECIAKYESGERYMPVFTGQLKDEALPFRKIEAKKTRVFAAAPADWSFVVRKYLLSVIRLIQTNKFVFETAVGTNAASMQWSELRDYLVQHGEDHMIAGDYGRFDKTMPPCIILAAYEIIREICREAGYTEKQLKVVQGIAEDTAFPLINFNGDLIEFYGSNPSGHPLTVIINSLANSLYMRYCYSLLSPDKSCVHFKRDVALMTYGDDNAMGVRKEATFFNHTAIQDTLAASGITYTMADKEAKSVPYIHINEISFLKRLWRYDNDVGAYLAPLEMDSITKSLTVNTESKSLVPEAHAIAIMTSAHSEFFFHGKEEFMRGSEMLQRIIRKTNLENYVQDNSFPSWEELKDRFWRNSSN